VRGLNRDGPIPGAMSSSLGMASSKLVGLVIAASAAASSGNAPQRPVCQMAEALVDSVDMHLEEWDRQIEVGLNTTLNCSEFLEFVYLSRDRIRMQLDYMRGNFSAEDEMFRARGEDGVSTTWAMTYMSKAASLVSAHMHIHGVLAAARQECLSEHLQLLFLMSLRRLKSLMHTQLRHLWVVFQGTAELFRQGASKWLTEVVDLFDADLRTMESIMVSWQPPGSEQDENGTQSSPNASAGQARPGPPLPPYSEREPDTVALSTIGVLRRETFEEWDVQKPMLRALLRYVLPRDGHIVDFCAGGGNGAEFLNGTGLVTAYAYDPSPNIKLLSKGSVEHATLHVGPLQLWRVFDLALCLSAAGDLGSEASFWDQVWQNIDSHVKRGAVLSCGSGDTRRQALSSQLRWAPTLQLDAQLSDQLGKSVDPPTDEMCIFWRIPNA